MEYILVSACLLGLGCRYDGQEKANEAVLKLLKRKDVTLIPICPEQAGGLPTPRKPSERVGNQVLTCEGGDVTEEYQKGAEAALKLTELYGCRKAILKEKSPSCGSGRIYDGTFRRILADGDGVTAELLKNHGIQVFGERELEKLC